ncbi:GNAT family N-acetyltransferase [Vibrio sp. S9_S30]|uniref:GNAT family N-acetyltransferase n=1 Tax=Vibrio sp. S9_S30 TaxID=2720226 RepID=UPI0016802C2E|nr:GNAT family N-acetyltransferase [Vibrio sp. S9_S30]MBD1558133.1 GNAT family N-acetyltransferase [Vibrio sp. S9_S30]
MNKKVVLTQYNQFERININLTGYQRHQTEEVVRLVSESTHGSLISYFHLSDANVDAAIDAQVNYFKTIQRNVEWKVYDFDSPSDMGERLENKGFVADDPESFMVLDLDAIEDQLPVSGSVVEVSDEAGIRDAVTVQEAVWKTDLSGHFDYLSNFKRTQPDQITIYVVYDNNEPVSSGWITYNGDSPFAGIWGGSTLEAYRGKGCYTALLHQRINDAKRRGIRYLTIDASDMSKPIVEKHGFQQLAVTTPFNYDIENKNE